MSSASVNVANRLGLHARAAARFVHLANRFDSKISVSKEGSRVDGKSILGLLTLAAIKFVGFVAEMGNAVFSELPAWIPEMIIPVTFGLMTLRFAFRFLNEISGTAARTQHK